ncbi:serine/threonine-protein kinase [Glycomyces harbinensis]|uniref:non-specific serine/threonine protein kinase n=1 Tax=Glycomyces harbinensis TaxID=58114 RepID=A0A1G7BL66_9ACTN|nr:serine/threonine-protein kinase [Glycomyces harbinensis]SDE27838.1 serine/threonine protein kinase [Glycomyces harbinensis]
MQTVLADRYVLEQEIARGAVGVVWRALDRVTGDRVAVKILRPELRGEAEIFESFRAEAGILRTIDLPGVVGVKDFIVTDAVCAVVLEFIEGPDLRERLRLHGPLPAAEAALRCASAAETLAAIHRAGYRHGDVKPGNLMLWGESGVKFVDFGIARAAASKTAPSHGTPEYIAPEVASGDSASTGVDSYALGLVLYEALTGHSAYRGGSITDVVERHVTRIPVKPAAVDAGLWRLVEMLLALDPGARGDLDAVAAELRRLAPRLPTSATAPIEPELRERDATASYSYDPVTPHAPQIGQGALGAMLAAESAPADGDAKGRRGLLVLGAACALVLIAAAISVVVVFTGTDAPNGDDVADPSDEASTSAPADDESEDGPTEPATEDGATPGDDASASDDPESETDTPAPDSDNLSESEDAGDDSTEGTTDANTPGSDLIGSPMPDN